MGGGQTLLLKSEPAADDARQLSGRPEYAAVWCNPCQHQVEPDPAEMAARYGAETTVIDLAWAVGLFPLRQPASGLLRRRSAFRVHRSERQKTPFAIRSGFF
jgi:hypothetical protein